MVGYCGAEFQSQPPKQAPHAITNRLNLTGNSREKFYECHGVPQIMSSSSLNQVPWVIPVDIQSFTGRSVLTVPQRLTVYDKIIY